MLKEKERRVIAHNEDLEHVSLTASMLNASILMIDDDPVLIKIIRAHLKVAGYQRFSSVNNPMLAQEVIRRTMPDLVLMDIVMPGMNGFDLLEKVRKDSATKHLPVIMLTSSNDASSKLQSLEKGATDFILKPVDSSELLLRIRNILTVKAYQDQLTYYDNLTGLPNRLLFMDRLEWALHNAQRQKTAIAVLDIGIDHFRKINETLGPRAGDLLLQAIAKRFSDCVRQTDVVAHVGGEELWKNLSRLGGDEFSILLTSMASADNAGYVAVRLQESLEKPFVVDAQELYVTISIGISIYPEDGESADLLLQHAAAATEQVKKHGRSNFQFFSEAVHHKSRELLSLEMDLYKALEKGEFELYYQPQVNILTGRVEGVEALVRWNHPIRGLITPDKFIPLAERLGLIGALGRWVLEEGCSQCMKWAAQGLGLLHISINLSAKQFVMDELAASVAAVMQKTGMLASNLTLELTESLLMNDVEQNVQIMRQLKELGVELSIDDFGTGYSSLSYLRRFPVDELKIDRSFLDDVANDDVAGAIVQSIISLAHSLRLKVVAEGVEGEDQLNFLRSKRCSLIQGYYYSRPLQAASLASFVRTFNRAF